jgi:hypothetical protein
LTTQVQPSPSPRPEQVNLHRMLTRSKSPHLEEEMAKTHWEGKKSHVHKNTSLEAGKDKTHVGDVHMPDYTYLEMTMPDSNHLEARNYETYREDGYDAMNVNEDTIHECTRQNGTGYKTYNEGYEDESHAEKVAVIIKNHYEEVEDEDKAYTEKVLKTIADTSSGPADPQNNCVTGQMGTKDVTKMLTVYESTCQKGTRNKTYHKEMKDEATDSHTEEYRHMKYHIRVEGNGKSDVDEDPVERDTRNIHQKKTEMLNESHHEDVIRIFDEDPKRNQIKVVMKCDTHRPGCLLNNTVNYARPTEAMMSETLGIDDDKILDDDQEFQDEGHPEGHDDRDHRFGDMFEVPTDDKTRQALNRLSAKNVAACQAVCSM